MARRVEGRGRHHLQAGLVVHAGEGGVELGVFRRNNACFIKVVPGADHKVRVQRFGLERHGCCHLGLVEFAVPTPVSKLQVKVGGVCTAVPHSMGYSVCICCGGGCAKRSIHDGAIMGTHSNVCAGWASSVVAQEPDPLNFSFFSGSCSCTNKEYRKPLLVHPAQVGSQSTQGLSSFPHFARSITIQSLPQETWDIVIRTPLAAPQRQVQRSCGGRAAAAPCPAPPEPL